MQTIICNIGCLITCEKCSLKNMLELQPEKIDHDEQCFNTKVPKEIKENFKFLKYYVNQ